MNYIAPGKYYKMHTLSGYAAGKEGQVSGFDVDDPYGRDIQSYRTARDQIMNAVEKILPKLLEN
jgi:protein-tyrosine-phosphatase